MPAKFLFCVIRKQISDLKILFKDIKCWIRDNVPVGNTFLSLLLRIQLEPHCGRSTFLIIWCYELQENSSKSKSCQAFSQAASVAFEQYLFSYQTKVVTVSFPCEDSVCSSRQNAQLSASNHREYSLRLAQALPFVTNAADGYSTSREPTSKRSNS